MFALQNEKVEQLLAVEDGLVGYFYVYPDGTETLIEPGYSVSEVKQKLDNCVQIGVENVVENIIASDDVICFILRTEIDFWYWEISRGVWDTFWENRSEGHKEVTKHTAAVFVNSSECSHCGCSVGNFSTSEDAENDYKQC